MTFQLALVTPAFGLLAADQRAYGDADYGAGRVLGPPSDGAWKLHRIPRGWLGFGASMRFLHTVLPIFRRHRADDLDGIRSALQDVRPVIAAVLARHRGGELAYLQRAELCVIYDAGTEFRSHRWRYPLGTDESGGALVAHVPLGLTAADINPLLDDYCAAVLAEPTVNSVLERTRELFAAVRDRCGEQGAVGDVFDAGVLERTAAGDLKQWSAFNVPVTDSFSNSLSGVRHGKF